MSYPTIRRGLTVSIAALLGSPYICSAATAADERPASLVERADPAVIEEIVVTSRRRAESAQDIPISVTAFQPEDIERVSPRTLRDFDGLMPNVFIGMNTAGPSAGAIFIRGIGYADIEKTQSPAVGVVIDGVYQGTNTGQLVDAFDIQQLEVNRGPQGVLFGKNTTAGTMVVTRSRPTGEFGLKASAEAGRFDARTFKLVANAPIAEDRLAIKIGGTSKQRDGYFDNITQGNDAGEVDYQAFTTALLFTPNDAFEALLTYDRIEDTGDIPPQDPRFNGDDPFVNESDIDEGQRYFVNSLGLQMSWETGVGTFTSVTSWSNADDSVLQDFDGGDIGGGAVPLARLHTFRDQTYDQFTQELRFQRELFRGFDLTLGGYWFESDLDFEQNTETIVQLPNQALFGGAFVPDCGPLNANPGLGDALCQLPPTFAAQSAGEEVTSKALFAAATWQLTNTLELSGGVRWIDEEKDVENAYFDLTGGTPVPGVAYQDDDAWDEIIFETALTWQFAPEHNVYARYAEGFRSGGFSIRGTRRAICSASVCQAGDPGVIGTTADVVGPSILDPNTGLEIAAPPDGLPDFLVETPATFEPETSWSVELGSKNEFLERRLRVNLAAFYTELDGEQFSTIIQTPTILPSTNTIINNGSTREIQGLELELQALLHERFTLIANGGLQETESDDVVLDGARSNFGPGSTLLRSGTPAVIEGQDYAFRMPEWNWSLTGVYSQQIGPGMLNAALIYRGQDEFLIGANQGTPIYEDGYELLDASVSYAWTRPGGQMIRLFGNAKNITDEEYKEQILTLGSLDTGFQGWGPPFTWQLGVEFEM